MTQEILKKLQQIQQQAKAVHDLMLSLQEHAPRGAEGNDSTGQVRVSIGADGLPKAIRVEKGWQDRLAPQAVAQAVMEAFTVAVANGMRAWSEAMDRTSWLSRVEALEAPTDKPISARGPAVSPPAVTSFSGSRAPQDVAEDVLRAADRFRRQATSETPVGVGVDNSGNVSITLSRSGLEQCTVQTAWALRQDNRALTSALETALHAARSELDAQASRPSPDAFNDLLGEALAVLQRTAATTGRVRR